MAVTMCWWNVVCITPSSWWWGWYGTRDMHARTNEGVPYQSLTTHWSRVARSLHPKLEWGILQLPPCMLHNAKPSFRLHAMALPRGDVWRFASSRYYLMFHAKQQLLTVVFLVNTVHQTKMETNFGNQEQEEWAFLELIIWCTGIGRRQIVLLCTLTNWCISIKA